MSRAFLGWFPSVAFANVLGMIVLAAVAADEIIPRLRGATATRGDQGRDRHSFLAIQLAALVGLVAAVFLRYHNVSLVPAWVQALAIGFVILGALLREWAVFLLGRFFSRTVEIETNHRLIIEGPHRWIRHPAYTGMVIVDAAIVLGLGTWAGTLLMLLVVLAAALYRVRVEERALTQAFGEEYLDYMKRTWRLLPGW